MTCFIAQVASKMERFSPSTRVPRMRGQVSVEDMAQILTTLFAADQTRLAPVKRNAGSEIGHNGGVTTTSISPSIGTQVVNRPNTVAVGTIVWLGSEVMFFAGLFAIYF